jgi:hypothetical protein
MHGTTIKKNVLDNLITNAYSLLVTNLLQKVDINKIAQLTVFKGNVNETELEITN